MTDEYGSYEGQQQQRQRDDDHRRTICGLYDVGTPKAVVAEVPDTSVPEPPAAEVASAAK